MWLIIYFHTYIDQNNIEMIMDKKVGGGDKWSQMKG
jgi:hypothetical protein